MRWNGTNEDLSGAGISFYFTFCFIKKIFYIKEEEQMRWESITIKKSAAG